MSECVCRCHLGGAFPSCDQGPEIPGGRSCVTLHSDNTPEVAERSNLCGLCGAFGDLPHAWCEGDCILPHKAHSRNLVPGAHVCEPCTERWDEWLTETVDLYASLPDVLLAGSVPDDTAEHKRPKKAPASPSPLRLDAWALLHPASLNSHVRNETTGDLEHAGRSGLPDVPAVLGNWAQACYDALGYTATAPDTVTGAVAVLRANAVVVARLEDVDEYDAELRWVRRSLRNAHGLRNPKPHGECLSVGCGGIVWPATDGQPKCDRCKRVYGTLDLVRMKANGGTGKAS